MSWRELSAHNPPKRFAKETYWARPLPALGDPRAKVLIVCLAPAAHGGNRTGRMFTGDEYVSIYGEIRTFLTKYNLLPK